MSSFYDISVKQANGEDLLLSAYKGKVLLIVNTATRCGLVGQFEELETLWNTYSHDDFVVLGFPCGQFANQEPGNDEEIQTVCKMHFGVTFPLFAKLEVNGKDTHPLYTYLKGEQ